MSRRYVKDSATGRVTELPGETPDPARLERLNVRLGLHEAELGRIDGRARLLAIQAGFTHSEYRVAPPRTVDRWRNLALDALLKEGETFSAFTIEYVRPVS